MATVLTSPAELATISERSVRVSFSVRPYLTLISRLESSLTSPKNAAIPSPLERVSIAFVAQLSHLPDATTQPQGPRSRRGDGDEINLAFLLPFRGCTTLHRSRSWMVHIRPRCYCSHENTENERPRSWIADQVACHTFPSCPAIRLGQERRHRPVSCTHASAGACVACLYDTYGCALSLRASLLSSACIARVAESLGLCSSIRAHSTSSASPSFLPAPAPSSVVIPSRVLFCTPVPRDLPHARRQLPALKDLRLSPLTLGAQASNAALLRRQGSCTLRPPHPTIPRPPLTPRTPALPPLAPSPPLLGCSSDPSRVVPPQLRTAGSAAGTSGSCGAMYVGVCLGGIGTAGGDALRDLRNRSRGKENAEGRRSIEQQEEYEEGGRRTGSGRRVENGRNIIPHRHDTGTHHIHLSACLRAAASCAGPLPDPTGARRQCPTDQGLGQCGTDGVENEVDTSYKAVYSLASSRSCSLALTATTSDDEPGTEPP
ncbi:hypothetical protein C8R45DRAFT_924252 [Mycena sanguinolenta]|nr:hypothetical protein C8R45DRAFT_924252 [Mycena sanguinolenta]